jgi:hypothetical protein
LLLVEEGDLYVTSSTHAGETEHFRTFTCPECGVETDLAPHDLPTPVWNRTDRPKPQADR